MTSIKYSEASTILNLRAVSITELVKKGVLKKVDPSLKNSLLDSDSVYEYKKELDERRSISPVKWVYRNDF